MTKLADPAPSIADLPNSPWIVRSDAIEARNQANLIVSRAKSSAAQIHEEAAAAAFALKEAAREEGLREGAAAAARLLADMASSMEAFRSAREAELGALAFAIAHRILGSFPETESLARSVQTALEEHRNATGIRLRAHPETAFMLQKALNEASTDAITVEIDEALQPGSCTLVHPRGRIAVGPLDQLLALFAKSVRGEAS